MKLNNLEDFTKNNWYLTTSASSTEFYAKEVETNNLGEELPPLLENNEKINLENLNLLKSSSYQHQVSCEESANITFQNSICSNLQQLDQVNIACTNNNNNYIMPTTTTITANTMQPNTTTTTTNQADLLAVEELVHEIKENLRLKARPSTHNNHGGRSTRPSPYHIPCRSWNDQQQAAINNSSNHENHLNSFINKNSLHHHHYHHHHHKKEQDIDDPYELLQTLLKSKNLVKEAVRRLQLNSISPKQRSYFYESDDDSRSPMFRMCQLEL